ncbi:hypothetical protein V8F20_003372 [Naviculisporaceae sp. PSN 640]
MADQTGHVREYLSLIWRICMWLVNLISTTFRILFWILFACIIAAILYDLGLYAFRTIFGFGAGRPPKTIDAEPDPSRDSTIPPISNDDTKKDK